jgi:hemerythrin superfamily protein
MWDKLKEDLREAVTGSTTENDLRARLHADHDEISKLLGELAKTTDADVAQRIDVRNEIEAGLKSHAQAEEEVVYRRIQMDSRMRDETEHSFAEHAKIDAALATLMNTDPADPAFDDAAKELRQIVHHHVHDEENELLPKAEQILGHEQLAALIPSFNDRKRMLHAQVESEQRTRALLAGEDGI